MLNFLLSGVRFKKAARALYGQAVDQARKPRFYAEYGVPDNVDGRFDMISLHVILIMMALPESKDGQKLGQRLFDVMFRDMDKALREMGIGDLSVPKHMKRMMNGFNGRMLNYKEAIEEGGALDDVLSRNVFAMADDVKQGDIDKMAEYVRGAHQALKNQEAQKILDGIVDYPEL